MSADSFSGADTLFEWFGHLPSFHDAELLELTFSAPGAGRLVLHAWNITRAVSAAGFLVTDRHAVVTFTLNGVSVLKCEDFDMAPGIVSDLAITPCERGYKVEWSSSYGLCGVIIAKDLSAGLVPGKPGSRGDVE